MVEALADAMDPLAFLSHTDNTIPHHHRSTMTTDYRALCSQLLDVIDNLPCETNYKNESRCAFPIDEEVVSRARLALAHPEPEELTDDELDEMYYESGGVINAFARSVIAADRVRWGRPVIKPVPVAERLPGAEDLDDQGTCWMWHPVNYHYCLCRPDPSVHTHWLPHHVLPVPQ